MPRPMRPLDPDTGLVQRFAHELRELRESAGEPTYRELARRTQFSMSALADAARGDRMPSLAVTLAFVEACAGDTVGWAQRWHEVTATLAEETTEAEASRPPYLGLATYQTTDAELFFGREALLDELLEQLAERGFLAVLGPSGIGKSSLLRAGLLPAVRDGRLPKADSATLLTPGPHPEQHPLPEDGLLVVDQFEELYTVCRDTAERTRFIDRLLAARPVVIGMRADFLGHCARHAELAAALTGASMLIGPMTAGQLRSAIVKPAARVGLGVEPELVSTIVRDVGDEPGTLPLLSHALLETWRIRRGKRLSLGQYEAVGGLHGAVAATAERVFTEELSEARRGIARRVFLRLVVPGEGTDDSGRAVRWADLAEAERSVVDLLVNSRLLQKDAQSVRLAHEALLRSWPRFQDWLADEREVLRLHRALATAAAGWAELGREPAALYRGSRLAAARERLASSELTELEGEFLAASAAGEAAERLATERRTRRLRWLAAALAALLVVAVGTGAFAWHQRDQVISRQLAAEALGSDILDSQGAAAEALRAYDRAPTVEARGALLSIAGRNAYTSKLVGHTGIVKAVAFSPDRRTLASGGQDGVVRLWDYPRGETRRVLRGHRSAVRTASFNPDGTLLATGDRDGRVLLWSTAGPDAPPRELFGQRGVLDGIAFSADGRLLAAGGEAGTVVWDTATGAELGSLPGHGGQSTEVAIAGQTVAIAEPDGQVTLWDYAHPDATTALPVSKKPLYALAISPDGNLLAAGGADGHLYLWDLPHRRALSKLFAHVEAIRQLTFTDGGRTIATAGYDRTVLLWDVAKRRVFNWLNGSASPLYGVAASPDGRYIAAGNEDRAVVVWDRARMPLAGHDTRVSDVAYAPDGRHIASVDQSGVLDIWDLADREQGWRVVPKVVQAGRSGAQAITYRPDGTLLATAGRDGTVRLWNPASGEQVASLTGHTTVVDGIAFSPDGRLLASAGLDGKILLWDVAARTVVRTLEYGALVTNKIAFSPDGSLLASRDDDSNIALWRVADGVRLATMPSPTQGVQGMAFSPDGSLLATAGGDGRVLLWDVAQRTVVAELTGHSALVRKVAFSPDGRFLASCGPDQTVIIWDVVSRTRWATLTGTNNIVISLAFSPDSRTVASAGGDHTITLWPLDPSHAEADLRAHS